MRASLPQIIVVLVLLLLIFGAPKLPMIARNIGKSLKILKTEVKDLQGESEEVTTEPGRLTDGQDRADVRPRTEAEAAATGETREREVVERDAGTGERPHDTQEPRSHT